MKATSLNHAMIRRASLGGALLLAASSTIAGAAVLVDKSDHWGNSHVRSSYRLFAEDVTGTSTYTLRGHARADAYALGSSTTVARADGSAISYRTGAGRIRASFRVFNQNVWDYDKIGTTNWNESFSWTKSFTLGSARFWVGPIPVRLRAVASVNAGADLSVRIVDLDSSAEVYTPKVIGEIKPKFDAALSGSVSIDAVVAEAGVRANLTLIGLQMPFTGTLAPKIDPVITTNPILGFRVTTASATLANNTTSQTSTTARLVDANATATQLATPVTRPAMVHSVSLEPSVTSRFASSRLTAATSVLTNSTGTAAKVNSALLHHSAQTGRTFVATWDVDATVRSLNGSIELYARYPNPFSFSMDESSYKVIEWGGFQRTYDLASGSKEITFNLINDRVMSMN